MISANSNRFKYIDRNKKSSAVLIQGWATDYRIFEPLELEFNYLVPVKLFPHNFTEDLLGTLKEHNIKNVSILGYSLGGFLASEFASRYPELVDELILVGMRIKYDKDELDKIKENLKKSKKGYLYKFYAQCFIKQDEMTYFKKNLLKGYLKELDLDYLLDTLDYLGGCRLKAEGLKRVKRIKIIHARDDKIAPIEEAFQIKSQLPQAETMILEKGGHSPWIKRL